jgi:hypothetical protein
MMRHSEASRPALFFTAQNKKGHLMKDDPLKPKTGNKNGVP